MKKLSGVGVVQSGYGRLITPGFIFLFLCLFPFWASEYVVSIAVFIGINAIVALGLGMLAGFAGQFSFGTSAFYGIGAYVSGILSVRYGVSPWLGMVCGVVIVAVIAYIVGSRVLHLHGFVLGSTTLVLSWVTWRLLCELDFLTGGYDGFGRIPRFSIGRFVFTSDTHYYFLVLIILLVLFIVESNLINSSIGRTFRSIDNFYGGKETAASTLGVDISSTKNLAFVLCAIYASIGGSFYAHYVTHLNPEPFHTHYNFLLYLMVTLGGARITWGPIAGATIYFGLKELITYLIPKVPGAVEISAASEIILFALLFIAIITFLPEGLFSLPSVIRDRLRRGSTQV